MTKIKLLKICLGVQLIASISLVGCNFSSNSDRSKDLGEIDDEETPELVSNEEPIDNTIPNPTLTTTPSPTNGGGKRFKLVTILATNDIHGGIEANKDGEGNLYGGMEAWAGIIKSIKSGIYNKYGPRNSGVLVVDGGDQFQGTLISNYDEGKTVIESMRLAGYDAVVPGNHDYDFGPFGWLEDKVQAGKGSQNPREVIESLSKNSGFPLLSANTYLKETLSDLSGVKIDVDQVGCKPKSSKQTIEFALAKRPNFLKPYIIKSVAGLKVALIGVDNPQTSKVTQIENVSDLCFRDPVDTVNDLRKQLVGKADVFVVIIHDGNTNTENNLSKLIEGLTVNPELSIDAVVGGHTHFVNNVNVRGVPGIQSGADGKMFGRIDLFIDPETKKVIRPMSKAYAGIRSYYLKCDKKALLPSEFCDDSLEPKQNTSTLKYENVPMTPDTQIGNLIESARNNILNLAGRILGVANEKLTRNRNSESSLANVLTDASRALSNANIALLNAGGIRKDLDQGQITYEGFFEILPINNRLVRVKALPVTTLISLLERSVKSCGNYGSLMPSGIRVTFERDCQSTTRVYNGVDKEARLLKVESSDGQLIADFSNPKTPNIVNPDQKFNLVTFDFLLAGGSGYDFKNATVDEDLGIAREVIANYLEKNPTNLSNALDGRLKEVSP